MPLQISQKPRIWGRFVLLSALGVLGAVSFVPSLIASAGRQLSVLPLVMFVLIVSVLCIVATWVGLRFADAAQLRMPYLRRLDQISEKVQRSGFVPAIAFGCFFAASAIFVLHFFHQANLAGAMWSRVASVFFAAGSLELVVHLFIMSLAVHVTRGCVWAGILIAAVFFVGFHIAGLTGQSASLIVASVTLNGVFGIGLGVLYARYGFEYVLVCHAVAHVLAVTLA